MTDDAVYCLLCPMSTTHTPENTMYRVVARRPGFAEVVLAELVPSKPEAQRIAREERRTHDGNAGMHVVVEPEVPVGVTVPGTSRRV